MTGMFSARKIESPEVTFWVIEGPGSPQEAPDYGWGNALSEAEAEVAIGRLEAAYAQGLVDGRRMMSEVAREAAARVRAAGRAEGLAEGRTEAEMRRG